jgi:hypothetical protein
MLLKSRIPLMLAPLLLGALPLASAHDDNDRGNGWRRPAVRGGYGYGYSSYQRGGGAVVNALRDLNSIAARARVDSHERDHFRKAIRELSEFHDRAQRGRFDRGSLDSAIDNMEHLAAAHQLHPRDRAVIHQDLQTLRILRSQGGWR